MAKYYNIFRTKQNKKNRPFYKGAFPSDIRKLDNNHIEDIKEYIYNSLIPDNLNNQGKASQTEIATKMEYLNMICREISVMTDHHIDIKNL